jgi:hypothetical protein
MVSRMCTASKLGDSRLRTGDQGESTYCSKTSTSVARNEKSPFRRLSSEVLESNTPFHVGEPRQLREVLVVTCSTLDRRDFVTGVKTTAQNRQDIPVHDFIMKLDQHGAIGQVSSYLGAEYLNLGSFTVG